MLQGVEFWAVNTDAQALDNHPCQNGVQIGTTLTRGLGTGGKPELGESAAQESVTALQRVVAGADLIFITAGMGGGTGTGAAPVIARLAKDAGGLWWGLMLAGTGPASIHLQWVYVQRGFVNLL